MKKGDIAAVLVAFIIGIGGGVGATLTTNNSTNLKPKTTLVQPPRPTPGFPRESSVHPEGYTPSSPPFLLSPRLSQSNIHISNKGLALIEGFEGFSSCPYWDPYGSVWTRGFGETDFGGNFSGRCISRVQGQSNLRNKVESEYQWAVRQLGVNFNQNQVDALDSFIWNLGAGIFQGTLRYDLQHRQFYAATRIMLLYDHAGGQVLEGLRIRREREVALFLKVVSPIPQQIVTKKHQELVAAKKYRAELRVLLTTHRCRIIHGSQAYKACPTWGYEGKTINKKIRAFEKSLH